MRRSKHAAFALGDLLITVAAVMVLGAIALTLGIRWRADAHRAVCAANLKQVSQAILLYARDNHDTMPEMLSKPPGGWWWYKEQVKQYAGLRGDSSPNDRVFACPDDRGYDETGGGKPTPFCQSQKHNFTSYVFNGVNLPGMPHIAGRPLASIEGPSRTLSVMEWTAHAPLSWHDSHTGSANSPFYNDALSMVGFVDGHVKYIRIYYDGMNPAYTRDPVPGYEYKYSGD